MLGRTNTGGGGGAGGAELVIVGGITRPEKASHNTLWAKTDKEITSTVLSAAEPENSVKGMLWVEIGNASKIKTASLVGSDWITVYPISVKQCVGNVTSFRYIKLQMDALSSTGTTVQFSDIRFVDDEGDFFVYPSGTSVSSSIAAANTEENEKKLIDNDASTKFCSGSWVSGSYILIDLGASGSIDLSQYRKWQWYTAFDATSYPARNLTSFSLWGSNDGTKFTLLDSVTNHSVPAQNSAVAYTGICSGADWVDVPAMIYQNGKWDNWSIEIFTSGKGSVISATAKARNQGIGTINVSNDGITVGYGDNWAGSDVFYYTNDPIDVTDLSVIKLTAQISEMRTSDHFNGFGLVQSIPPIDGGWADQNWVVTTEISDNSNISKTFTVDISNISGQYYFLFTAAATKGTITDIKIE